MERGIQRFNRRWATSDPDVGPGPHLRARRNGELRCLDASNGSVIWGKNILRQRREESSWAMAASPLIVDDKVIVLPGGTSGKSVVAYNKMTALRCGRCSTTRRLTFRRCWLSWRTTPDRGCQFIAWSDWRLKWRAALELSMGHGQRHQRLAADRGRSESFLYFVRLWERRGAR